MFLQIVEFIEQIALEAEQMRKQKFETHFKLDGSQVTSVDLFLHNSITKYLSSLTSSPIVSEEDAPSNWVSPPSDYWLLDPLDGTRHFVEGDGEYAVVLGHVINGKIVEGVVSAPAFNETYAAQKSAGATLNGSPIFNNRINTSLKAFSSGYHEKARGKKLMGLLNISEIVTMGSALKMCRIARGDADIYPRFGETYEWDTAGAQVILEEAGAQLWDVKTFAPIHYGKPKHLNQGFIAFRNDIKVEDAVREILSEESRG